MNKFEKLGINSNMLQAINSLGFTEPTDIQEKTIPHILEGKDIIGQSATGSGKTLAFGTGILETVSKGKPIQALVLTPTRELAHQVKDNLNELTSTLNIALIYGGVSLEPQRKALHSSEIVVATPGRLLDHLNRRNLKLSNIDILVLDEADRMLDMGFIDDIEKIIKQCKGERQTLFFSATMPSKIQKLAQRYMNDPISLSAQRFVDHSKLKQSYYNVQKNVKLSLLAHLLKKEPSGLAMVFCNTRRTVDFVVKGLKSAKLDAIGIHGGDSQNKRNHTLNKFTNCKVGIMVCTDVAARGLHIDNVSHIYNYDLPRDPTDYVHRIGRTARAGEEGKVINLLSEKDHDNMRKISRNYSEFDIERIEKPYVERVKFNIKPEPRSRGRGRDRRQRNNRSSSPNRSSFSKRNKSSFKKRRPRYNNNN